MNLSLTLYLKTSTLQIRKSVLHRYKSRGSAINAFTAQQISQHTTLHRTNKSDVSYVKL